MFFLFSLVLSYLSTYCAFSLISPFQSIRVKLEETLPGTGGGKNQKDEFVVKLLFLLPLCALLFCVYRSIQVSTSLFLSPLATFFHPFLILNSLFFLQVHEGSLFNQIRYLYYRIRSSGTRGVSTFSTMNPSYQVCFFIKSLFLNFFKKVVCISFEHLVLFLSNSSTMAALTPRFLNT